jgi:hypothetical protein
MENPILHRKIPQSFGLYPDQISKLQELSRQTGRSLSDLAREGFDQVISSHGKGIVAADEPWNPINDPRLGRDGRRLVMAMRHNSDLRNVLSKLQTGGTLKEQWNAPIALVPAPAARLRNFVILSEEVVGAPGDTVTVPYAKDFELDILAEVGATLTPKTGLLGTVSTTLKEAAATTDVDYADIEKFTPEILAALEGQFTQASYRAEDKEILDTLYAESSVPELDKSSDDPAAFPASYIAEALGVMGGKGKDIMPWVSCVLIVTWPMYEKIVADIASTQSLAYAQPDAIRTGILPTLIGVTIVATSYLPSGGSPAKYSAYLLHRNAAVLAPKRELLMETERKPRDRTLEITGSHTFGDSILDAEAAVEIKTGFAA